jgi:undecaprenyl-diphosphatase
VIADLSNQIHGLAGRSGLLDSLMKGAAEYLIFAVLLVFVALWFQQDGLRIAIAAALGAVVAIALGVLIGDVWTEQRPFVAEHFTPLIAHPADAGFPSDHLLALGGVVGAMLWRARLLAALTTLLAVVVAFARVFVGVHYVGDVAGGFAIGVACGLLAWLVLAPAVPQLASLYRMLGRRRRAAG